MRVSCSYREAERAVKPFFSFKTESRYKAEAFCACEINFVRLRHEGVSTDCSIKSEHGNCTTLSNKLLRSSLPSKNFSTLLRGQSKLKRVRFEYNVADSQHN